MKSMICVHELGSRLIRHSTSVVGVTSFYLRHNTLEISYVALQFTSGFDAVRRSNLARAIWIECMGYIKAKLRSTIQFLSLHFGGRTELRAKLYSVCPSAPSCYTPQEAENWEQRHAIRAAAGLSTRPRHMASRRLRAVGHACDLATSAPLAADCPSCRLGMGRIHVNPASLSS
jgi:hypothetical protein